ncbi:D-2-hydroxyacid dehydrogenase family protein [Citreimonas sp.]|uniref:D-2-hydroxyacid dehydrogenase family protein n=1 Tax=Citreimonas sp. TaxID=3036715 RepID=UPI0040580DF7
MTRIVILDDYQQVALRMADWSALQARCEIDVLDAHIDDTETLAARLAGAEVVLAMRERTPFDAARLERLPDLKLLVTTGPVNRSIDVAAANRLGITVCGTPGGGTAAAELAFGLILALARRIPQDVQSVRDGDPRWQAGLGVELAGKTLGIAGFGRLGRVTARYAAAFGMQPLAWSRTLTDEDAAAHGARPAADLAALLRQSDVLSIHLPLTTETRGVFDRAALAQMKPGAMLVNTSRGPIVDEGALIEALDSGRLRGAALDVFDIEPLPVDHPFRSHPAIIATPHMGYVTEETYRSYFCGAVTAIEAWLNGTPIRVLTP